MTPLEQAVEAYEIARCKAHGAEYPKNAMSLTNRKTIEPMTKAAINAYLAADG